MRLSKLISVLTAFIIICVSLSSCGYEISINKKNPVEEFTTTIVLTPDGQLPQTGDNSQLPDVTPPLDEGTGSTLEPITDAGFVPVAMSSADVITFYKSAMNDVKVRAPGYTRNEAQEMEDVEALGGDVQLMNRILNLVGTELLKDSGDEKKTITVLPHDDIAVRATFPLYGKDTGCELTDLSIVKSANCYTDGKSYKLVITFDDQLNPEPDSSAFSQIMTPVDRDSLTKPIEEYLVVLDYNSFKFDITYSNCEIVCTIDKATNRMTSLKQRMNMDIDIVMNLDLIIFQTKNVKARGRIVNTLEYSDFNWG